MSPQPETTEQNTGKPRIATERPQNVGPDPEARSALGGHPVVNEAEAALQRMVDDLQARLARAESERFVEGSTLELVASTLDVERFDRWATKADDHLTLAAAEPSLQQVHLAIADSYVRLAAAVAGAHP